MLTLALLLYFFSTTDAFKDRVEAGAFSRLRHRAITDGTHILKKIEETFLGPDKADGGGALEEYQSNIAESIERTVSSSEEKLEKSIGPLYEEPKKVMGVALNGKDDFQSLESSLILGTAGTIGFMALFSVLRKRFPAVYMRDFKDVTQDTQKLSIDDEDASSLSHTDWLYEVWNASPDEEIARSGLDGWAFLEFCRLNCRIIAIIAPVLWAVLMPLHYFANSTSQELDHLSRFDIGNLPHEQWMLWLHALLVWFVVLVSAYHISSAQEHFTERRHQWLKELPRPRATTVLVKNIPHAYRSDRALKEYFVNVFSEDAVERAYVVRKTNRLTEQVGWLEQARYNLAVAKKRWEQVGCPGMESPEGREVARCRHRRNKLINEVALAQAKIEAAVQLGDTKVCSSSGFVTFSSELAQRLASRERYTRDVTEFKMIMPPDPSDVNYESLALDDIQSVTSKWLGVLAIVGVFIFWIPVVVLISSWTTFSSIKGTSPMIQDIVLRYPFVKSLLSGVLATAALKLFMAFLPAVLHYIIETFLYVKSGTSVQLKLQRWYSWFLLIFVLLVTSLGRGLTITLVIIAQEPAVIISLLAASLPSASHFYFNYVILGWAVHCFSLLRASNMLKFYFYNRVCGFGVQEAKEYSEPEDPACSGMGAKMAMVVLTSAITFVFCSCSPMILAFTFVYFQVSQLVHGFLLLRSESKKPDLGGLFWMQAIRHLLYVLLLYVLLMTGVLHLLSKQDDSFGPPAMTLASLSGLLWAKERIDSLAFETLPLEEVEKSSRSKKKTELDGAYLQPECNPRILIHED